MLEIRLMMFKSITVKQIGTMMEMMGLDIHDVLKVSQKCQSLLSHASHINKLEL